MHLLRRVIALTILYVVCTSAIAEQTNFGSFTGSLNLHPVGDGVHMTVLNTYSYTDADGHTLTADPGFTTDGASIPRALWTIVGSPFTGLYLGAAVIHDVGCDTHKYSWQITHRMFYTAMRSLGVSEEYAQLLYWGVRVGGPRWTQAISGGGLGHRPQTVTIILEPRPALTDEQAQRIKDYIASRENSRAGAVTLDEIDQRTPLEGPLPTNSVPQ